ncbi:MAG: hypothetical protein R3296_02770 [Oleiphilaceae bacterium]|nr:hypothetical protein [Oleiphilaceae bacterium]
MLSFRNLRPGTRRRTKAIVDLLEAGRDPLRSQLDRRFSRYHAERFLQWPLAELQPESESRERWQQTQLLRYMAEAIEGCMADLQKLTEHYRHFLQRIQGALSAQERERVMLRFLRELGTSPRQLRGDRKAFGRWFGQDGVVERYQHRVTEKERHLIYLLDRLGPIGYTLLTGARDKAEGWQQVQLESTLLPALTFNGHVRVREAAMDALSQAMEALPPGSSALLSTATVSYLYRCALDPTQPVTLQSRTLPLLWRCAPQQLEKVLQRRLQAAAFDPDDFFFRRRALLLMVNAVASQPSLEPLLLQCQHDPSPYVRQTFAGQLPQLPEAWIAPLLARFLADPEDSVQATALLQLPALVTRPALQEASIAGLLAVLDSQGKEFVLRTALHVAPAVIAALQLPCPGAAAQQALRLEQTITGVHQQHPATRVRRWAALSREHLWTLLNTPAPLQQTLRQWRDTLSLGQSRRLSLAPVPDPERLHRALVTHTDAHFGFNLSDPRPGSERLRVTRDARRGFRLWRILHEWRHPATDKRQNYGHSSGRIYPGLVQVPSQHVSELSQTKVPGEPVFIADEGGWRPYLPLVDQLISALDQDWPTRPLRIYTAEGITWVTPPGGFMARVKARWRLTRDFAQFAQLRNWTPNSPFEPDAYLKAVAKLGFRFSQSAYTDQQGQPYPREPRVARFFPALALPLALPEVWSNFQNYFYSSYQNTLEQLLIFVGAMASFFFGRHLFLNLSMRRARHRLPLVVGGWGTRGKSGTERLKAAVFNAMGYQVLSKTTGCEAMFLHGHALQPLREMFLFRPYDKATIWEQVNLTRLAGRMQADVMLWECMGLTPRYVEILQRQWMRDDLSTITNCYPDHEDLQGPAGVDLPQVIARFIPRRGRLTTSEENMLPYLLEEARRQQTPVSVVNWLQAGLIAPDVLERFPYEEHPYNIALVVRMCESLGVAEDFALKEMADRVIPDLGVLKAYPLAHLYRRRLEFINGMSANERHGTLSNWTRMGMDRHGLATDPQVWVSTVVNNRADRVARSQVFASILVNDLSADRHYLIGGNVDGLMTYIRQAFDTMAAELDWQWQTPEQRDSRLALLERLASRYRVPISESQVRARLRALLNSCGVLTDESAPLPGNEQDLADVLARSPLEEEPRGRILAQWQQDQREWQQYQHCHQSLSTQSSEDHQQSLQTQLWDWLQTRLHVVEDYHASGQQLIERFALDSPPGLLTRMMGIQNIKGTGLDFIYRWQAWNAHAQALSQLESADTQTALQAAKTLAGSTEFGLLEEQPVTEAVTRMRLAPQAQSELFQAELDLITSGLQQQLAQIRQSLGHHRQTGGWRKALTDWTENFLDAGEAVRRRKTADRIYRDLADLRISHARATTELKKLTQAQKGGWLEARRAKR